MILGKHPHVPDAIDLQLLAALQRDAKAPLARLGELVGLSAPSVMERVRRLEHCGIIRGYSALVDARRVGLDVTAFIGVTMNYPVDAEAFDAFIDAEALVLECHHVTGGHTLLLKARCANTEALEGLISRLRALPYVHGTETMIVLSTSTERVRLPLPDARPDDLARARRSRRRRKPS